MAADSSKLGDGRRVVELRAAGEQGDRAGERAGGRRHLLDAIEHEPRDRRGAELVQRRPGRRRRERSPQLDDQQRIAAAESMHLAGRSPFEQRAGGLDAERRRAEDRRERGLRRLGRERDPGLWRARRRDEQHRQPLEPPGEVADEAAGLLVEPVQVIDREHQRTALRQPGDQPVQAVERIDERVLRLRAFDAQHLARQPRRPAQERVALVFLERDDGIGEQLPDAAEDEASLQLGSARTQNGQPVAALEHRLHQRGLADARHALDQHGGARAARSQLVDEPREPGEPPSRAPGASSPLTSYLFLSGRGSKSQ